MLRRIFLLAAVCACLAAFALIATAPLLGQCDDFYIDRKLRPKLPTSPTAAAEDLLPESAYLTSTTYTNLFFGFAIELPMEPKGHLIMLPIMPERQHALLGMDFEQGTRYGSMVISAVDPHEGLEPPTAAELQDQLRRWEQDAQRQFAAATRMPIPDYMMRTGRFNFSVRHKGENYAALFWTRIKNYNIRALVSTNDTAFLARSKKVMADARFYCPQDDGSLLTMKAEPVKLDGGEPYEGPTVPTARAEAALAEPPTKAIPAGEFKDNAYRNSALGIQYQLPPEWQALPATAEKADTSDDPVKQRHSSFRDACSRILLRATQPRAKLGNAAPATITLRALDPACLSLRTPATLRDSRDAGDVEATLEVLGDFGDISSNRLEMLGDHLFMVFDGTIGPAGKNDELAQRMSQTIFATRYDKLLLLWTLAAPSRPALAAIPPSQVTLGNTKPVELKAAAGE
jgi:hypothetical protein